MYNFAPKKSYVFKVEKQKIWLFLYLRRENNFKIVNKLKEFLLDFFYSFNSRVNFSISFLKSLLW